MRQSLGSSHGPRWLSGRVSAAASLLRQPKLIVDEMLQHQQCDMVPSDFVYDREREASLKRFERLRSTCREPPRPFSVAFSGGGVRAAAFQAGVVWRLAEKGRLRDVDHLSVVSGGSYIGTAFLSYLSAFSNSSDAPYEGAASVDEWLYNWYREVVWNMVDRMQHNAGFLVRFGRDPFTRKGARPAGPGLLALVSILVFAFVVLPVINFILVATPLAVLVEQQAGNQLRTYWCEDSLTPFSAWTLQRLALAGCLLVVAIVTQGFMVICKHGADARGSSFCIRGPLRLLAFSCRNLFLCAGFSLALLILAAWLALGLQFIVRFKEHDDTACHNQSIRSPWTGHVLADQAALVELVVSTTAEPRLPIPGLFVSWSVWSLWCLLSGLIIFCGCLGSWLRWPFLVIRQKHLVGILALKWTSFAGALLLRWRIFGPVDGEKDFDKSWRFMMNFALIMVFVVISAYGKLRSLVHVYYRRSLRIAFYHEGKDIELSKLQDNSFCPNIIVAATLVDYCRADHEEGDPHYSEFFFTRQFMGGDRTNFIRIPDGLSLSSCMAISGAATDAFLLTKMNAVWVRVTLLALFGLFMGSYVEFNSSRQQGVWCGRLQAFVVNLVFMIHFLMLVIATEGIGNYKATEEQSQWIFWTGWTLLAIVVALSFFATFKGLRWLLSSTIIRHIHMVMMHYHISDEPPLRLFLNDGGLVECLGLISLLRRRCKYMLVTDATADFDVKLVCLRDSMQLAEQERICTFFDPDEPRRGVEPLLQSFCKSNRAHMRIGVLYNAWEESGCRQGHTPASMGTLPAAGDDVGEVIFIRMRLVERGQRVGAKTISRDEFFKGPSAGVPEGQSEDLYNLPREDLGGCCCDCCHTRCNCGLFGRFPNIATGNQWLTPTQFALLCRLGYELSGEAIDAMTSAQSQDCRAEDLTTRLSSGGSSAHLGSRSATAAASGLGGRRATGSMTLGTHEPFTSINESRSDVIAEGGLDVDP
eukprot:TRINITY_DN11254_c0_g1_i2.p1 TRINITY_DN11254_c0_g1~~TRINITY_DN11254_c0_g1_i2.p1  ORF type:complete len:982 (-),score=212.94 TRINITY_DN11254_c0_g1_i2:123-3068(-)